MPGKLKKLFQIPRAAIVWTAIYFVVLYALFQLMFGFDILSAAHWARLAHMRLHGLPGLSFGLLLLSALPVYFAIMNFIAKNKKAPIPLPFCPDKKDAKKEKVATADEKDKEPEIQIPEILPTEMREPYLRAKRSGAPRQQVFAPIISKNENDAHPAAPTVEKPAIAQTMQPTDLPEPITDHPPSAATEMPHDAQTDDDFPLPTDFDFDAPAKANAPVFKSVSFGGADADLSADTPVPQSLGEGGVAKGVNYAEHKGLMSAMKDKGFDVRSDGEIVIATKGDKKFAIAMHDDPDFWIADGDDWFATGKQKASPVVSVRAAADAAGAKPVLYLARENIMELGTLREKWTADGIAVVTDLNDIE